MRVRRIKFHGCPKDNEQYIQRFRQVQWLTENYAATTWVIENTQTGIDVFQAREVSFRYL